MNSPGPVHGLTRENLVATLPVALQKDPSAVALAEAMAELLAQRPKEIEQLLIYPAIDRLDEQLLDILAYDFKVDWWNADYSVEEKRRTLKDSWRVHKMLGTKAAVETAIAAIYPQTKVLEWFEYGGEPYHFRIKINSTDDSVNSEKQKMVLARMAYYKNLRSHLDEVTYFMQAASSTAAAGVGTLGSRMCVKTDIPIPREVFSPQVKTPLCISAGQIGIYSRTNTGVPIPEIVGSTETALTQHTAAGVTTV